jgi:hypothetical protein
MKIWIIYAMVFALPTQDEVQFTTENSCKTYLSTQYPDSIRESFKIVCIDIRMKSDAACPQSSPD